MKTKNQCGHTAGTSVPGALGYLSFAAVLFQASCAPSSGVVRGGLDVMSAEQRHATFESMATALDEKPEYVDELYRVARTHPKMFNRFLADTVPDMQDPELAQTIARLLVRQSNSLERVFLATIDAAKDSDKARIVLVGAMKARTDVVADMLFDDRSALIAILGAAAQQAQAEPKAREALLAAMRETRGPLAAVLVTDAKTLQALTTALVDAGATRIGL